MKRFLRSFLLLVVVLGVLIIPAVMVCAATTQTVHVHPSTLTQQDSYTDIASWHFVINQIDQADQPATIHVIWSNGYSTDVPMTQSENKMAHYTIAADSNTWGALVTDATAEVPGDWKGNFNLSDISRGTPPVPELAAGALLGIGLVGVGAYIFIKRRKAVTTG